jgi:hypothetical protein
MKNKAGLTVLFIILIWIQISAQNKHAEKSMFKSYKGLVMAGYQGWFNCEGDGADRGWTHYNKNGKFEDGSCTIDFWPEMDEYKVKYKTPFKFADGSPAFVFSSFDESTVDLHFKWMKEYGIDGVFMQRFFSVLESQNRLNHNDEIDEGTAIMKCAHDVPVGKSVFVPIEKEVPSDHYLWLTGMAGKMLRGEIPFSKKMPEREK